MVLFNVFLLEFTPCKAEFTPFTPCSHKQVWTCKKKHKKIKAYRKFV